MLRLFPFLALFILVSCQQGNRQRVADLAPGAHQVVAEEVIQTSKYTYIRVSEDEDEYWIAIERTPVEENNTYFWSVGTQMKDFTGTEANRTFESIYFVQDFTDQPIRETAMQEQSMMGQSGSQGMSSSGSKVQIPEKTGLNITPAENGVTIGDLYSSKADFAGKKVLIRGEVVKFSPQIMDRNWVHIQDGTKDKEGNYDLTITTDAYVNAGDVILFEGTVALDKDFGYGYFYPVILEEAVVK